MAKAGSWVEVNVEFEGFKRIDFDKKNIRTAMRAVGRVVSSQAKNLVSGRGGPSRPGENPHRRTGALRRSIAYRVSRPGFLVRVAPLNVNALGAKDYYPAFLYYGVTGLARRKDHKAQPKDGSWQVAPRANYMVRALEMQTPAVRALLASALENSLIPRK